MIISFIGDICLGRYIREKYESCNYQLVSQELIDYFSMGRVIANLESPVADDIQSIGTRFSGSSAMLQQFNWVDCFSLANNHINDFGEEGMTSTIQSLNNSGIRYNGLFENVYKPYVIEEGDCKVAVFTCADKVNRKLETSKYSLFFVEDELLHALIKDYHLQGYLVIVYAHMGSMFCRYPNPSVYKTIHKLTDLGVDCICVSHSHCVGGVFRCKDIPCFYGLGDFLMDGESFRRRRSCSVSLNIMKNKIVDWVMIPAVTGIDLQTTIPDDKEKQKIIKGVENVSESMTKGRHNYRKFYKWEYKYDMLCHSISTISFLYHTKGLFAILSSLTSRMKAYRSMLKRITKDRTNMRNG